jgi:Bacterial Ig-like domain (group 3)
LKSSASIVTAMITGPTGSTSQIAAGVVAAPALAEVLKASVSPAITIGGTPVTLTATLTSPAALWVKPTGTVEFLDNGVPIGSAMLGASGTATLTSSTLPTGSQSLAVVYQGDHLYSKTQSAAVVETILIRPTVLASARVNVSEVQVYFSLPMGVASATDIWLYQLTPMKKVGSSFVPAGNPLSIKATIDPTHRLVTLVPTSKLLAGTVYRLTINNQMLSAQGAPLIAYAGYV